MEEDRKKLPVITPELVDYLRALYPDVCPDVDEDERRIWVKRGEVGVVRHLAAIYDQQNAQGDLLTSEPPPPPPKHLTRMRR